MTYSTAHKQARMTATRDRLNGGALQILNNASTVLASTALNNPSGTVSGDTLTLGGFPKTVVASSPGTAASARFVNASSVDEKTGLTVGIPSSAAPAWAANTAYTAGQVRTNGANIYTCSVSGTSASGGGPTGTAAGITDGTAAWDWLCIVNAAVQIDNGAGSLAITAGASITISGSPAPTLVHAA